MLSNSTIEAVRQLPIEQVIGLYLELKKTGSTYKANSPFTQEKTPSFSVTPAKNIFKCFSSGKGGDGIHFVMEHKNLSFIEAVEQIAKDNNIIVEYQAITKEEKEEIKQKQIENKSLTVLLNWATTWFASNSLSVDFIRFRFGSMETVVSRKIGYAPNEPNALFKAAELAQYPKDLLLKAGLIIETKKGEIFDYFQHRCMIPTLDSYGNTVGFTGRIIEKEDKYPEYNNQKYKYSPGTVWVKANHLYGIDTAYKSIKLKDKAFLVEGQIDTITISRKGLENTLGIGGSSISDEQIKQLKRITKNICYIADNDALKSLEVCKEKELDLNLLNLVQNNPGIKALHKNCQLLVANGFTVEVLVPPVSEKKITNADPDDYAKSLKGDTAFKEWIKSAQTYIEQYLRNECFDIAQLSPKDKAVQIKRLGTVIDSIQDDLERSAYYDEVKENWSLFAKGYKIKKGDEKLTLNALQNLKKENRDNFLQDRFWEEKGFTYATSPKGSPVILSEWTMSLPYSIESDMTPGYICVFKSPNGATKQTFMPTDEMNTRGSFRKFTERYRFVFRGKEEDLDNIKEKKIKDSIQCQAIPLLGQIQNFYALSNGVHYNGRFFEPNKFGVVHIEMPINSIDELRKMYDGSIIKYEGNDFKIQNIPDFIEDVGENNIEVSIEKGKLSYYNNIFIPMAQKISKISYDDPYEELKKFKNNTEATTKFNTWAQLMFDVYGKNAYIGISFFVMSIFRDIIYKKNNFYCPNLFCFGPRQQGKSTFCRSLTYPFGIPAKPDGINIEQGSTPTGMNRTMASFRNATIWFNEFKNSISEQKIGVLKGIADGTGKTVGLKTNDNNTTDVRPVSTAIISGQDLPRETALFSRCITLEFNGKNRNSDKYEELNILQEKNEITSVLTQLLGYREQIGKQYESHKKRIYTAIKYLYDKQSNRNLDDRYFLNFASVITPMYTLYKNGLDIPFNFKDFKNFVIHKLNETQELDNRAQESDVFFSIVANLIDRGDRDALRDGEHIQIKDNELRVNLSTVHPKYTVEASRQGISPFDYSQLEKYLMQHEAFIIKKNARFRHINKLVKTMFFDLKILEDRGCQFILASDRKITNDDDDEVKKQSFTPVKSIEIEFPSQLQDNEF